MMRRQLGYTPNLLFPRSFNEKIARRKLRQDRPEWSVLADKWAVRDIVGERIGAQYLNQVYLVTDDAADVRVADLPPRFVVKATHASGFTWVADRAEVRDDVLQARCRTWLASPWGSHSHEYWYAAIPPRLIVERRLEDATYGVPLDFKFWVFHGRVAYIHVDMDRFTNHTRVFYDRDWRPQPWSHQYPPGPRVPRPTPLDLMIELAERLAGALDFVRVDLYCVDDREILFGEITLAPEAGWGRFLPDRTVDFALGTLW